MNDEDKLTRAEKFLFKIADFVGMDELIAKYRGRQKYKDEIK